jgi:hypothetical protein
MLTLQQKVKLPLQGDFTMLKLRGLSSLAAGLFLAAICLAAPAQAHPVTYVSGKGNDANDCFSPATPCRSFQRAVAGGEVKALDPADYFPVTINKSISLTGVPGAGIVVNGGDGIDIKPGGGATAANFAYLIIENVSGSVGSNRGISAPSAGGSLTVKHCTVRGFGQGISVTATPSTGGYLIADTVVTNNGAGIFALSANGTLDHVVASFNQVGVLVVSGTVSAVDTIADQNGIGFELSPPPRRHSFRCAFERYRKYHWTLSG